MNTDEDFTLDCLTEWLEDKTGGDTEVKVVKSGPEYAPEIDIKIDHRLTEHSMMSLIKAEVTRKKLSGYHIDSMNLLYSVGIEQIITGLFSINGHLKNERETTDAEKEINEISFDVKFVSVSTSSPQTTKYKSGTNQMMTPNMARTRNLTYSCPMTLCIDVSATAHKRNGESIRRSASIKDIRCGSIFCMVRSQKCNLYGASRETCKMLEEDPNDPGGYFIIGGQEWSVNSLENITNNSFHIRRNIYQNEVARGTILSKPGDTFENSYQTIIRLLNNNSITVEVTTGKFEKFEIPFYLIFRALGMTRDRDIVDHIVFGVDNDDTVTRQLLEILARAFNVDDAKFGPIKNTTDSNEIIEFIANSITTANTMMAKKDDNIAKYLNNSVLSNLDRHLLPHVGSRPEDRIKKLRYLALLINRLLRVYIGVLDPVDHDSYKNKRVLAAGPVLAKTLKTYFNIAVVQEIRRHLTKDFKSTPFSSVDLEGAVRSSINSEQFERYLTQAITSKGKKTVIKRNEIINRVSSQIMYRKNDMNMFSTLGTINAAEGSASKQNERADEMRRYNPSALGFVCPSQSADTGEDVGMTRQYTITASSSAASSTYNLRKIMSEDPDIIPNDNVRPEQISAEKLSHVYVGGDVIGFTRSAYDLAKKYRARRRHGDIHHTVSIVVETLIREIYFIADMGRILRPLIIVYNNIEEYMAEYRAGNHKVEFKQWILLTQDHIDGLRKNTLTMDDLRAERIIEYIAPEEQENAYIAPDIDTLRAATGSQVESLMHRYTHCDIPQAVLGLVVLAAPLAGHSNAVRNTMYTNHRKQSAAWPTTNYPYRIDKGSVLQHYCEKPLITTLPDSITNPNGQNTIVALNMYGGTNCEDSLIVNRTSVECGLFNASVYNYTKYKPEKGEQFGNPDFARTIDIKKNANYEHIGPDGFIKVGTLVKKDYVLIVCAAKIPNPVKQFRFADKSVVYRKDEPVIIERVIQTRNSEDAIIAKVKWRANRPLGVGDKLCMTPDHDVLTTRGWVPIALVTTDDRVACLHAGTVNTFSYMKPSAVHSYEHDGEIYEVKGEVRARVTLDHKMYVCADDSEIKLTDSTDSADSSISKVNTDIINDKITKYKLEAVRDIVGQKRYYCNTGRLNTPTMIECNDTFINVDNLAEVPDVVWSMPQSHCRSIMDRLPESMVTQSAHVVDNYMRLAFHAGYASYSMERGDVFMVWRIVSGRAPVVNSNCKSDFIDHYTGNVYCLTVPTGVFLARYRGTVWWTGNSSRTGNKGVVASMIPRCDMPYTENGITPDIIGNPLSIPTRMAVNQLIECTLGMVAAIYGVHIDATAFITHDFDHVLELLSKAGINNMGHQRMYNGMTGMWLDVLIFVGPTTYQRLLKFVIDEHYATRAGPSSAVTHQPLDGKNNDGGLRIGEMEQNVYNAHGTMRALWEKFYKDSDGVTIPICKTCGNRAVVNEKLGIFKCKKCKDAADIYNVQSSWAANLFFSETQGSNIKMEFELAPHVYPEEEK